MAMRPLLLATSFMALTLTAPALAKTLETTVHAIGADGVGITLGTIQFKDTRHGLFVGPNLTGLAPGTHGFHIHAKPSCAAVEKEGAMVAGLSAGGHYDPTNAGQHAGPASVDGHKGDLPVLVVDTDGTATVPTLAARLRVSELHGRSVIIHADGDNYADEPKPLGGGGTRVACGVMR